MPTLEIVSVAPIDTMLVGMEKSYSGQNSYESVQDSHLGAEQADTMWPTNLDPSISPLSLQQASDLLLPAIRNARMAQGISQDNFGFQSQQQGNFSQPGTPSIIPPRSVPNSRQEFTAKAAEKQQRRVSSAPQTKSQQQNAMMASKAMSNETDNGRVDLEKLIRGIFAGTKDTVLDDNESQEESTQDSPGNEPTQSNPSNKIFLVKSDAIKISRILSTLLLQRKPPLVSQPRKPGFGFNATMQLRRRARLRHEKAHEASRQAIRLHIPQMPQAVRR
jgi:hypothetical protein